MLRQRILDALQPSSDGLLRHVSGLVDDAMLTEIAKADYGQDADEHLKALRRIRDLAEFPKEVRWVPLEVLELIRWSEPEDPSWKPGSPARRGHLMRAFACAALLSIGAARDSDDRLGGENQTLAQLLASLSRLDAACSLRARQFLAWRLREFPEDDEERPFFIFALLLLSLEVEPTLAEPDIETIADWLMEDEQRVRTADWTALPDDAEAWLLGLTHYDIKHSVWAGMGERLGELSAKVAGENLRQRLLHIADLLTFCARGPQ